MRLPVEVLVAGVVGAHALQAGDAPPSRPGARAQGPALSGSAPQLAQTGGPVSLNELVQVREVALLDRMESVTAQCVEAINGALEFEVDAAHAIAMTIRRVVALCQVQLWRVRDLDLLGRDASLFCAVNLAAQAGARFDLKAASEQLPEILTRADVVVALPPAVEGWLRRDGGGATGSPEPVPPGPSQRATTTAMVELRAFIATPLTRVSQDEHDELLPMARAVADILRSRWHFRTWVPGQFLSPHTSDDHDDVFARYEREHELITSSDLLVIVGCENDSWGLSKTVTWAEAAGIPVVMLGRGTSPWCRVLSAGPFRVEHDVVDTLPELTAVLESRVPRLLPHVLRHASQRRTLDFALRSFLERAREHVRDVPAERLGGTLPPARVRALLSSASVLAAASVQELRGLREVLGPTLWREGLEGALEHGLPSSGRRSHVTGQRKLGSLEFDALRTAAVDQGWADTEVLSLLVDFFTLEVAPREAAYTKFGSPAAWIRRAKQLRGKRR